MKGYASPRDLGAYGDEALAETLNEALAIGRAESAWWAFAERFEAERGEFRTEPELPAEPDPEYRVEPGDPDSNKPEHRRAELRIAYLTDANLGHEWKTREIQRGGRFVES